MNSVTLILPYPVSANVYWRTRVNGRIAMTYVSKEAKDYKAEVSRLCRIAGVTSPLSGRVLIDAQLFPAMPQDWERRKRRDGDAWDDTVRCIDLDNANKVMLDALKGVAIEDDKWVRRLTSERMTPDGKPARIIVTITPWQMPAMVREQDALLPATPADLFAGVAVHQAMKDPF